MILLRRNSFTWIFIGAFVTILEPCDLLALLSANTFATTSLSRSYATVSRGGAASLRLDRTHRRYMDEDSTSDDGGGNDLAVERVTERPTQTRPEPLRPAVVPAKPKIVVLGASGLVGRSVVRQLLEMSHLDVTVVAFVRDYDKACRVLYDDLLVAGNRRRGPKLQIVQGDLVPADCLPGYTGLEEEEWSGPPPERSVNNNDDFNASSTVGNGNHGGAPDESLRDALRDCTTIISCVGAVRPTNVWSDFLARPLWRLFRSDVSDWCNDPRHPFYVHYHATRTVLNLAEREQLRREAAASALAACSDDDDAVPDDEELPVVPRIRLIRISDLCVAQPPWYFVPLLTNMLHSVVLRYHDMAEKALEASTLIETVTLRPGDLVDEERDCSTTSLQVDPSGCLPSPNRVGRDDVAALAVAAALFDSKQRERRRHASDDFEKSVPVGDEPFHYTFACRWASDRLDPYPSQGQMADGFADANLCLQSALRTLQERENSRGRRRRRRRLVHHQPKALAAESYQHVARLVKPTPRKIKPHGICVAIPVYAVLFWMFRWLLRDAGRWIPGLVCVQPVGSRVNDLLGVCAAVVLGGLSRLQGFVLASLPHWLVRRSYYSKYISF